MKSTAKGLVGAAVMAMIAGGALWAASLAKSGSIERVTVVKNTGASSMETSRMYWEGDRLRAEMYTIHGGIVEIKDGKTLYTYAMGSKTALKMVIPEKERKSVQQMFDEERQIVQGGKKVGTGRVAGLKCDVYAVPAQGDAKGQTIKVWMSTDSRYPLPMKLVVVAGSRSQTVEVQKIKLNYNVPDTKFALPKGMKIEQRKASEMPKDHPPAGNLGE